MKPKILIIDDEALILLMLKSVLNDNGYDEVKTASDYESALSAVSEDTFDIIVSDIMLGKQSGIDFLQELKRRGIETPVVLITGKPDIETAIEAVRLGAFDYLRKPFDVKHFLTVIAKMINQKSEQERRLKYEEQIKTGLKQEIMTYQMHLERLQSQIDSATDIYQNLIKLNEKHYSVNMSWRHRPLANLGGDFIDIREMKDSIDIILADVAGHDIGSSFHTIILKAFFEENCHKGNDGHTLFRLLNQHLLESGDNERMITGIFLRLNLINLTAEIVSAAHPWISIVRKESPIPLCLVEPGGDVLGMLENPIFICNTFNLFHGDRLFIHTDGVVNAPRLDAASEGRKRIDAEGFAALLMRYRDASLEEMVSRVWQDILNFCENKPKDDMLLLGIEIPEPNPRPLP